MCSGRNIISMCNREWLLSIMQLKSYVCCTRRDAIVFNSWGPYVCVCIECVWLLQQQQHEKIKTTSASYAINTTPAYYIVVTNCYASYFIGDLWCQSRKKRATTGELAKICEFLDSLISAQLKHAIRLSTKCRILGGGGLIPFIHERMIYYDIYYERNVAFYGVDDSFADLDIGSGHRNRLCNMWLRVARVNFALTKL